MKVLQELRANNVSVARAKEQIFFMWSIMIQARSIFNRLIDAFGDCLSPGSTDIYGLHKFPKRCSCRLRFHIRTGNDACLLIKLLSR